LILEIHPENPQARLVQKALDCLTGGGLLVYPTDSTYAFGWLPSAKAPQDRVARLRKLTEKHLYAIACKDLRQAAEFGKMDNRAFALVKRLTPGPYTFVLPATSQLPKRLHEQKRRTIGVRIPDNRITQAILAGLTEPLMTSSIPKPAELEEFFTSEELFEVIEHQVDIIIDGGSCGHEPTTLLDLCVDPFEVLRQGKGEIP